MSRLLMLLPLAAILLAPTGVRANIPAPGPGDLPLFLVSKATQNIGPAAFFRNLEKAEAIMRKTDPKGFQAYVTAKNRFFAFIDKNPQLRNRFNQATGHTLFKIFMDLPLIGAKEALTMNPSRVAGLFGYSMTQVLVAEMGPEKFKAYERAFDATFPEQKPTFDVRLVPGAGQAEGALVSTWSEDGKLRIGESQWNAGKGITEGFIESIDYGPDGRTAVITVDRAKLGLAEGTGNRFEVTLSGNETKVADVAKPGSQTAKLVAETFPNENGRPTIWKKARTITPFIHTNLANVGQETSVARAMQKLVTYNVSTNMAFIMADFSRLFLHEGVLNWAPFMHNSVGLITGATTGGMIGGATGSRALDAWNLTILRLRKKHPQAFRFLPVPSGRTGCLSSILGTLGIPTGVDPLAKLGSQFTMDEVRDAMISSYGKTYRIAGDLGSIALGGGLSYMLARTGSDAQEKVGEIWDSLQGQAKEELDPQARPKGFEPGKTLEVTPEEERKLRSEMNSTMAFVGVLAAGTIRQTQERYQGRILEAKSEAEVKSLFRKFLGEMDLAGQHKEALASFERARAAAGEPASLELLKDQVLAFINSSDSLMLQQQIRHYARQEEVR